jgi:lysozyme
MMQISENGIKMIKGFEAFRSKPYLDSVGVATIGYGTTVYPDGKKVTMKDTPVTELQATDLLTFMINFSYGKAVNQLVRRTLSQNQFDALCSLVYNIGVQAFSKSNLLKFINNLDVKEVRDFPACREQFMKWVYAGGKQLAGLLKRRKKEADLFYLK